MVEFILENTPGTVKTSNIRFIWRFQTQNVLHKMTPAQTCTGRLTGGARLAVSKTETETH